MPSQVTAAGTTATQLLLLRRLVPTIDSIYPLAQTRDTLARLESGGVEGKIVVVP